MDIMKECSERFLWFLSSGPPLVASICILCVIQLDPGPLLDALFPLIPGYIIHKEHKRTGTIRVQIEAKADFWGSMQEHMKERLAKGLSSFSSGTLRTTDSKVGTDESECSEALEAGGLDRAHTTVSTIVSDGVAEYPAHQGGTCTSRRRNGTKVLDFTLNLKHLVRTSAVPIVFLCYYFWDMAIIHREPSRDFPLENCMDPDASICFWINASYTIWRWPSYMHLDCDTMFENTVNRSHAFDFKAPEGAAFFKCYEVKLNFAEVIGALGDVAALLAIGALLVLRCSVSITTKDSGEDDEQYMEEMICQRRKAKCYIVVCMIILVGSVLILDSIYGTVSSDFCTYTFVPGACIFAIILLKQRIDIISEKLNHKLDMEKEGDSTSDDEHSQVGFSREDSQLSRRNGHKGHLLMVEVEDSDGSR